MNTDKGKSGRWRGKWLAAAMVAALVGVLAAAGLWLGVWWSDREPSTGLPVAKLRELVRLKNIANGVLENERFAEDELFQEAVAAFSQLIDALPEDPLGRRNLAVMRLLNATRQAGEFDAAPSLLQERTLAEPGAPAEQAFRDARQAIDAYLAAYPESGAGHWLRGKLLSAAGLDDLATLEFQAAVDLSPDNAAFWFAIVESDLDYTSGATDPATKHALQQAHRLAPSNLTVLRLLLLSQAKTEDPALAKTLDRFEEEIAPIESQIGSPITVDTLAASARQALAENDWRQVTASVFGLSNLCRGLEAVKLDLRRVSAYPLEFMLHDFQKEFYLAHDLAPDPPAPTDAALAPLPQPLVVMEAPAMRVQVVDFDLDGRSDLLLLKEGALEIYTQGDSPGAPWKLLDSVKVPAGMTRFFAADMFTVDHSQAPKKPPEGNAEGWTTKARQYNTKDRGDSVSCYATYQGVILFGPGGVLVLQNQLDQDESQVLAPIAQFDDAVDNSAAPRIEQRPTHGVAPVNIDQDGDLDLVLLTDQGVKIWLNRGNATFLDVSEHSKLPPASIAFSDLVVADWDRDVDLDVVLVGEDRAAVGLLENMLHGNFRWRPFADQLAGLHPASSVAVAEFDGNVSWDLASAGRQGLRVTRTVTPRPGIVQYLADETLHSQPLVGVKTWDYDNDSFVDLVAWRQDALHVFRGGAEGAFAEREVVSDPPDVIQQIEVNDLDGDGDLDLVVLTPSQVVAYLNEGAEENNWLAIRARGLSDNVTGRNNHYGVGALLEVKTAARYQAQFITGQQTHFGLGAAEQADVARILWPNGLPQDIIAPQANQVVCEMMVLKGSCPYVYTWNGERFEFFTDCLWAAPLGLQLAEGVLAPDRPWEYLLIPGDRLALHEPSGEYVLQFTEELWEAAYVDQIQLIAVDHPDDVEVYSNEKVGPAEIAEFKVHTARRRRAPAAAHDKKGRDVLPQIQHRDGKFFTGYEVKLRQGLTEEHFLQLDLGDLHNPQSITLFLTGWIYPTDTSINISLSQNPDRQGPRPPWIEVVDEQGEWTEVVPYMGFPGGKTKTIAVDISGVFLTDDYRLRICTTNEIYWDEAFFTVDEEPAPMKISRMKLTQADLHYRGFSARRPRRFDEPERYDYDRVSRAARWPPMRGAFTRYGDVQPLLAATDDRLVVMSAGDEATLHFAPPSEDPPPGWRRDFLLYNVGWDKDADLNTVAGQDVAPMPFQAMLRYPYAPEQSYPDTPKLRAYLKQYQTRRQVPQRFWRRLKQHQPGD